MLMLRFKLSVRSSLHTLAAVILSVPLWTGSAFVYAQAVARSYAGVVIRVVDGDTVWVKTAPGAEILKVRIVGIDAPEICQSWGRDARAALEHQILGQTVALTVSKRRHDDYGRLLARIDLGADDVGRWMVVNGHAWSNGYGRQPGPYSAEQSQAQLAQRGLFADGAAELPRSFRKWHGSCHA